MRYAILNFVEDICPDEEHLRHSVLLLTDLNHAGLDALAKDVDDAIIDEEFAEDLDDYGWDERIDMAIKYLTTEGDYQSTTFIETIETTAYVN